MRFLFINACNAIGLENAHGTSHFISSPINRYLSLCSSPRSWTLSITQTTYICHAGILQNLGSFLSPTCITFLLSMAQHQKELASATVQSTETADTSFDHRVTNKAAAQLFCTCSCSAEPKGQH
jgi:hypothetical protein